MVTDRMKQLLRHALGLNRRQTSYRNYYVAARGSPEMQLWEEMLEAGLARRGRPVSYGRCYQVTDAGRAAVEETAP